MANGNGDNFLAGVVIGGVIGFAVGIMTAPKTGSEIRSQVWDSTGNAREQLLDRTEVAREQLEDILDTTSQRLEELRSEAANVTAALRQRVGRSNVDGSDADKVDNSEEEQRV